MIVVPIAALLIASLTLMFGIIGLRRITRNGNSIKSVASEFDRRFGARLAIIAGREDIGTVSSSFTDALLKLERLVLRAHIDQLASPAADLFSTIEEGIALVDEMGVVRFVNDAFLALFEYPNASAV